MQTTGTKIWDVVNYWSDGLYGIDDKFTEYHPLREVSVDCCKLWKIRIDIAGEKFIPICEGISGEIGSPNIDENFDNGQVDLPIDTHSFGWFHERKSGRQ